MIFNLPPEISLLSLPYLNPRMFILILLLDVDWMITYSLRMPKLDGNYYSRLSLFSSIMQVFIAHQEEAF